MVSFIIFSFLRPPLSLVSTSHVFPSRFLLFAKWVCGFLAVQVLAVKVVWGWGRSKSSESVQEVLPFSPLGHARASLRSCVFQRRNLEDLPGGCSTFVLFIQGGGQACTVNQTHKS